MNSNTNYFPFKQNYPNSNEIISIKTSEFNPFAYSNNRQETIAKRKEESKVYFNPNNPFNTENKVNELKTPIIKNSSIEVKFEQHTGNTTMFSTPKNNKSEVKNMANIIRKNRPRECTPLLHENKQKELELMPDDIIFLNMEDYSKLVLLNFLENNKEIEIDTFNSDYTINQSKKDMLNVLSRFLLLKFCFQHNEINFENSNYLNVFIGNKFTSQLEASKILKQHFGDFKIRNYYKSSFQIGNNLEYYKVLISNLDIVLVSSLNNEILDLFSFNKNHKDQILHSNLKTKNNTSNELTTPKKKTIVKNYQDIKYSHIHKDSNESDKLDDSNNFYLDCSNLKEAVDKFFLKKLKFDFMIFSINIDN